MTASLRLHRPTIVGRLRQDSALLLLTGLVVALTTAFAAAVGPVTERTADRAVAASVRDAGSRGAVVATFPRDNEDPRGQTRDPNAAVELGQDTEYAQSTMPDELAAAVRPGVASLTTPALQLLDAGPGRYLRLAYLDPPAGELEVTYVSGGPPQASVGGDQSRVKVRADSEPWPVQVAVSEETAAALGLEAGDQLPAKDQQARPVDIRIAGVFSATAPDDEAWTAAPQLLHPVRGAAPDTATGAALVSAESLPDLRLAVPLDDLTQRVVFAPRPSEFTSDGSVRLVRAIQSLKTAPGIARGKISWDSLLDGVLDDANVQVATARGQADVLLVGMLNGALLVLLLAAQLLVGRRSGSVVLARERGAPLLGIAGELLVESLLVAAGGVVVGLVAAYLLADVVSWGWLVPVLAVACLGGPVLGVVIARRTDSRRVAANRSARRIATRARQTQRYVVELAVVAVALLSFVALRQRGVTGFVGGGGSDLAPASAPTWWAVVGALVVARVLTPLATLLLRRSRGSVGGVRFFALARIAQTGSRVLPALALTVAVLTATFGLALAATEHQGQAAGALLSVGGDARLSAVPDAAVEDVATEVASAPGVDAAVAARVEDGVRASSRSNATAVRLVVVDAAAYEQLLASSALPDAPDLALLSASTGDRVPVLLLGGEPGLRDRMVVRWDDLTIAVDVVGTAPRVDAAVDPVVVVDAEAFAATGAVADPNTVWAIGPGAAAAVQDSGGSVGSVELYADVLTARREAPLASGLTSLAIAAAALLLLFAALGVVLSAAAEGPARAESLGRLRALGLSNRELRRLLVTELLTPVVVAVVTGLALGAAAAVAMFGSLGLEQVTGQTSTPDVVLSWWTLLVLPVLVLTVLALARTESAALRRTSLSQLLRAGDRR